MLLETVWRSVQQLRTALMSSCTMVLVWNSLLAGIKHERYSSSYPVRLWTLTVLFHRLFSSRADGVHGVLVERILVLDALLVLG